MSNRSGIPSEQLVAAGLFVLISVGYLGAFIAASPDRRASSSARTAAASTEGESRDEEVDVDVHDDDGDEAAAPRRQGPARIGARYAKAVEDSDHARMVELSTRSFRTQLLLGNATFIRNQGDPKVTADLDEAVGKHWWIGTGGLSPSESALKASAIPDDELETMAVEVMDLTDRFGGAPHAMAFTELVEENGTEATGKLLHSRGGGSERELTMTLKQVEGRWLVDAIR